MRPKQLPQKRAKLLYIFFIIALLFQVGSAYSRHKIIINGNPSYKHHVSGCLDLLAKKYPEAYQFSLKYIGVIAQAQASGMIAWSHPPVYHMSDKTAFYSLTWCASSIAHDAYHSYLYKKYKPHGSQRTPDRYWADFKAERKAIQYQIRVAKKIGSSKHELDYLGTLDGKHADVNGDGIITLKDRADRDW